MFDRLSDVEKHFESIEKRLSSPEITSNPKEFQRLSKEHSDLQPLVVTFVEYRTIKKNFEENKEIIKSESGELAELAQEENKDLVLKIEELEHQLRILLLPKDPNDEKNILVEIRAGAGGDEAGIFAGDLFKMYSKFAEGNNWKVELMSTSYNAVGGFKEVIAMISGEKVYSKMKYESGVHRVQRVPQTETQGRVHTSTVTVAVLPEAEEVEVSIDPSELRIDVFRSSGPGGQSVNTTDSAVRITHLPSQIVVTCQDEKSQHKNKAKAMKILKTRLLDIKRKEQDDARSANRLSMVGTGDRSEKIRTYNYPQGRITDHRIGFSTHNLEVFMLGDIDELVQALQAHYESIALKESMKDSS